MRFGLTGSQECRHCRNSCTGYNPHSDSTNEQDLSKHTVVSHFRLVRSLKSHFCVQRSSLPVLALTERWNLGFRESKCFLTGPELLTEKNTYKISGNLVTNLIIAYLLILRGPGYTQVWHQKCNTSPIGFTQLIIFTLPKPNSYCTFAPLSGNWHPRSHFFSTP